MKKDNIIMMIDGITNEANVGSFGYELLLPIIEKQYSDENTIKVDLFEKVIRCYAKQEKVRLLKLKEDYYDSSTLRSNCYKEFLTETTNLLGTIRNVVPNDIELEDVKKMIDTLSLSV